MLRTTLAWSDPAAQDKQASSPISAKVRTGMQLVVGVAAFWHTNAWRPFGSQDTATWKFMLTRFELIQTAGIGPDNALHTQVLYIKGPTIWQ